MADNVQVSCIRKREHFNPHERIEGLGGIYNKARWYLPEADIIAEIEKPDAIRRWNFYTNVNGHAAWVIVALHNHRKYLKTQPDAYREDNLLDLADRPK